MLGIQETGSSISCDLRKLVTDASSAAETPAGIPVRNLLSSESVGNPASSANGARASLLPLASA